MIQVNTTMPNGKIVSRNYTFKKPIKKVKKKTLNVWISWAKENSDVCNITDPADVIMICGSKAELLKDLEDEFEGWDRYAEESKTFEDWIKAVGVVIQQKKIKYQIPLDLIKFGLKSKQAFLNK